VRNCRAYTRNERFNIVQPAMPSTTAARPTRGTNGATSTPSTAIQASTLATIAADDTLSPVLKMRCSSIVRIHGMARCCTSERISPGTS
jgi:hypothetical protein